MPVSTEEYPSRSRIFRERDGTGTSPGRTGRNLFGITGTSAGLVFLSLCILVLPPRAEASPRFLYFLKGHVVHRLSFPDLRSETILVFAEGEVPEGPEKVRASAGKVAWVSKEGNVTYLLSWDGSGKSRLPLERHVSMEEGIFGDAYLSAFLLSPDGSKIVFSGRQEACHHRPPMVIVEKRPVPGHDDRPEDQTRRAWRVHGRAMRTGLAGQSACASWGVPCVER